MKFVAIVASLAAMASAQSTLTAATGCPTGPAADQQVMRSNLPAPTDGPCPTLLAVYASSTVTIAATAGGNGTVRATATPSQFRGAGSVVQPVPAFGLAAIFAAAGLMF